MAGRELCKMVRQNDAILLDWGEMLRHYISTVTSEKTAESLYNSVIGKILNDEQITPHEVFDDSNHGGLGLPKDEWVKMGGTYKSNIDKPSEVYVYGVEVFWCPDGYYSRTPDDPWCYLKDIETCYITKNEFINAMRNFCDTADKAINAKKPALK